jgi:hypothetical protein
VCFDSLCRMSLKMLESTVSPRILLIPSKFNGRTEAHPYRTATFLPISGNQDDPKAFRNREVFYSLFKIESSLRSIEEKMCYFSLGWVNRWELMLSPDNALTPIMSLKPHIVWDVGAH